ncbi:MAG TPA: hypothetical protein VGD60_02750 [Candidatus Acidoferrales bacterium]
MTFREWWGRASKSRYTRGLEAEITRLRAENRALLNSILGIAGVPPVIVATDELAATDAENQAVSGGAAPRAAAVRPRRVTQPNPGSGVTTQAAGPVARRRSWPQIYRALEMDSAKKKAASESI